MHWTSTAKKYINNPYNAKSMLTVMHVDPLARLKRSRFRQEFGLSEFEKQKVRELGIANLLEPAREIVLKKLNNPIDDGRQTPFYGNPIFKAMHATATCCRKCLFKWHRIPPYRELTEENINYIVDLIYRWIKRELYTSAPVQKQTFVHVPHTPHAPAVSGEMA
jgi:hypothetical protein